MSRVAVIACDHGLGHVRRCVLVGDELSARGEDVTLLAPPGALERIRRTVPAPSGVRPLDTLDLQTMTTPSALRAGDAAATRWHERLPDLDAFDRVVVDTLPEVLAVRPDTVLLAQFLWHDVLDGVDAAYAERAAELAGAATRVLGSVPFAMPAVRALPGFRPVGLHAQAAPWTDAGRPAALLVAGGVTDLLRAPLRGLVADLIAHGPGPWARVHVDLELLPVDPPDWLVRATHAPAMYREVTAAVVRPGLGTLTELIVAGATVVCVREGGNAELAHNAAAVVRLGLGADLGVVGAGSGELRLAAVDAALDACRPTAPHPELRLDGSAQAADLIVAHPAREA